MLGIFRVHGLALIRKFLLAERDLLTFPDFPGPPALSAQIRGSGCSPAQVRLRAPSRKPGVRPTYSDDPWNSKPPFAPR